MNENGRKSTMKPGQMNDQTKLKTRDHKRICSTFLPKTCERQMNFRPEMRPTSRATHQRRST